MNYLIKDPTVFIAKQQNTIDKTQVEKSGQMLHSKYKSIFKDQK